ncbi:MAG: hypothetical protein ABJF01_24460 [bacterium]
MKLIFALTAAPLVIAHAVTSAPSSRIAASPPRVQGETIHIASRSGDQPAVAGQRGISGNASDTIRIVAGEVPSRLADFEARRRRGIGRFITDSVLRAEESRPLTMVLRSHLPGLSRVLDARPLGASPIDHCGLEIYLNGLRSIDTLAGITPRELSGVEFYTSMIVPPEFHHAGSSCPVLVLWSAG